MTLNEVSVAIGVATTIVGAVVAVWKKVIRPHVLGPVLAHVERVEAMFGQVASLAADVLIIKKAVGPNGGQSLADAAARTEQAVRHMEARQRISLAAIPAAIFETDAQGRFTLVNRAFLTLLDTELESARGAEWVNLIHYEDRERVMRQWGLAIRDQRSFIDAVRFRTADGVVVSTHVEATPVRDDRGNVLSWFGVVTPKERTS